MEGESGKKMDVIGVICEYDPFHLGHRRQFELIRLKRPKAAIVCLMSGCFTQRGTPALYSPTFRARAALNAGADMVLELPAAYAVRDAEHFALGGVSLLSDLGFITELSFGAEDEPLLPAAQLLEAPDEAFDQRVRQALASGVSLAAAQGAALMERFPQSAQALQKPNNILALCYLRALIRLKSPLRPLAVRREGNYHANGLCASGYPSAKAVRQAILTGDRAAAELACGYPLPAAPLCPPDALDKPLLYKLRQTLPEALAALPYCGEGLENRLKSAARAADSREQLLRLMKTKRYTYARLSRLCCHALLDIDAPLLESYPRPPYGRLLGFRKASEGLLSNLKQSAVPVIAKAADGDLSHPLYQLDQRAYDLWALGAGLPAGLMLKTGVAVC